MDFDYENAKMDVMENGGDPDYVSYYNEKSRDNYLLSLGLNPNDYKNHKQKNERRSWWK